jgi:hypothetical protein
MEFDVKVQNLAMIYYLIGRSHPQKRLMWVIYGTIAAKILWSSLFDSSNVNQALTSIYMTISNYSCQKYGTFSF